MAEKSAHLTSTNLSKPSIFDYIAQENLNNLLHPAAKKVVDAIYSKYPHTEVVWHWFEELFLASSSALQCYYLRKYGSTFAETFYGLRRVPVLDEARIPLTVKEIILSIITTCLIPYLRNKLNTKADEIYFTSAPRDQQQWKKFILRSNSSLQVLFQVASFVQHLRYLSGKSEFNSPFLWLIGLKLKYSEVEDNEPFTFKNALPLLLQRFFEVSAFFLQFYHWWLTENRSRGSLPVPPPPEAPAAPNIRNGKDCPLCLNPRRVDTVVSVSGFVFCFHCICRYLQSHQKCPITQLPATFEDLIRIYPPDA